MPRLKLDLDRELAERLLKARHAAGLTLHQVAERAGVSYVQIHKYESGIAPVPPARLPMLAEALGLTVKKLMRGGTA